MLSHIFDRVQNGDPYECVIPTPILRSRSSPKDGLRKMLLRSTNAVLREGVATHVTRRKKIYGLQPCMERITLLLQWMHMEVRQPPTIFSTHTRSRDFGHLCPWLIFIRRRAHSVTRRFLLLRCVTRRLRTHIRRHCLLDHLPAYKAYSIYKEYRGECCIVSPDEITVLPHPSHRRRLTRQKQRDYDCF